MVQQQVCDDCPNVKWVAFSVIISSLPLPLLLTVCISYITMLSFFTSINHDHIVYSILLYISSNKGNFYQASKRGMGFLLLRATELQSFTFCNVILKLKLIVPIDSINHLVCIITDCAHTDWVVSFSLFSLGLSMKRRS